MSTFNNGGGSLKSITKPAAMLEIANLLANAEAAASTTDNPLNSIAVTFDLEAKLAQITASLPINIAIGNAGNFFGVALNYIGVSAAYVPATGDLKSIDLPAAFLEMAITLSLAEKAIVTDPPNNVIVALDLENLQASVTASLPITMSVNASGEIVAHAVDYLPAENQP